MHTSHSAQSNEDLQHFGQKDLGKDHKDHYKKLLLMMIASFVAMYILMYAMVNEFINVIPNLNQFYMAGLMSSPMLVIELLLMGKMYPNKRLNNALIGVGVLLLVFFFLLIRGQTAIDDKQFLKSMIPHHAGAILMVEQSKLKDPEVMLLAQDIIKAQQQEIDFMKAKLEELDYR